MSLLFHYIIIKITLNGAEKVNEKVVLLKDLKYELKECMDRDWKYKVH